MELRSKMLEQIAYNTRSKTDENMLILMKKSAHEEHLSRSLQTNNKQIKIDVTFLAGYIFTFNMTSKNSKNFFAKSINDKDGFIQITIL